MASVRFAHTFDAAQSLASPLLHQLDDPNAMILAVLCRRIGLVDVLPWIANEGNTHPRFQQQPDDPKIPGCQILKLVHEDISVDLAKTIGNSLGRRLLAFNDELCDFVRVDKITACKIVARRIDLLDLACGPLVNKQYGVNTRRGVL
jgi:hypothetical protein